MYFAAFDAPNKELVEFESSAPMQNSELRHMFNAFLIDIVLPQITAHPDTDPGRSSSELVGADTPTLVLPWPR